MIGGTLICVTGAMFIAFLKGPKLLNAENLPSKTILGSANEKWLLGCVCLFGSASCWSLWLIFMVLTTNPFFGSYLKNFHFRV